MRYPPAVAVVSALLVQSLTRKGAIAAARAVFALTLQHFPKKKSIWLKAANLEKQHGSPEALDSVLKEAVANCPEVPHPRRVRWCCG